MKKQESKVLYLRVPMSLHRQVVKYANENLWSFTTAAKQLIKEGLVATRIRKENNE